MSNPAPSRSSAARPLAGLWLVLWFGVALIPAASAQTQPSTVEPAQPDAARPAATRTGLPLPRFVSLRSAEVNLRTGPGGSYPIEWVYQRRHMPVEVVAEFDNWRKIRDWQGTEGWVHQNLLDGARYVRVTDAERLLLSRPADGAPVARLMPGVIARIRTCGPDWCEVEAGGYRGWLAREGIWGVYPHETLD